MRDILSRRGTEMLEQFAWSSTVLAFDYDGTLAPIVADRDRAAMRPRTRELLRAVSLRYPVIVISGRAQTDARGRLGGTGVRAVVGNHGIEPWRATNAVRNGVRRWLPALEKRLGGLQGVSIEDKGFSLALHYRRSRAKKQARSAILEAAESLGDVRVIGGKQVVNILPRDAPHKGLALERERDRLGCDTAIYVGDDETDEDVFALNQPGRLLTIRVGPKRGSMADYCLRGQPQVDDLLRVLLDLRPPSSKLVRRRA